MSIRPKAGAAISAFVRGHHQTIDPRLVRTGMDELLTLIAEVGKGRFSEPNLPIGYIMRTGLRSDCEALGRLYYAAYEPGVACATLDEAVADIRASFAGDYGVLWPAASPLILRSSNPVAAALTVRRAPWQETPDCSFIIELFTDHAHRRRSLARALIAQCLAAAHDAGESAVALRVATDNTAARSLYESFGFRPWQADHDPA